MVVNMILNNFSIIIHKGNFIMLRSFLASVVLLAPLITLAEPNANAYKHANSNASFKHAPEIDGSNIILGVTLLGGIVSLIVRRRKK
jgi:hypothetical protein